MHSFRMLTMTDLGINFSNGGGLFGEEDGEGGTLIEDAEDTD
jgi:hypothetical protein